MSYHLSYESYQESAARIRRCPWRTIVFTNGCFDLLHPGHLSVIEHARKRAGSMGCVVVGLNDDESVKRLKGPGRPILDLLSRAVLAYSLKGVDYVLTFKEDTPIDLIRALKPDVIVKGGDYDPIKVVGSDYSLISIAPKESEWSTTSIVKKIQQAM